MIRVLLASSLLVLFGSNAEAGPPGSAGASPSRKTMTPLVRVVDLKLGESQPVKLCDGNVATVKLLALKETRDDIRDAVRVARVNVEINGKLVTVNSGNYHLPVTVSGVRIDCPITRGYYTNTRWDFWGLDKDARLRLWPAGSPLVKPDTFVYPVTQRLFASSTWMSNEPVDAGGRAIYYHSGLDLGGCEGLVEVVAAADLQVVGVIYRGRKEILPDLPDGIPIPGRYSSAVFLRDRRGWYHIYSHTHRLDEAIVPGRHIKRGQRIGWVGKEGSSGGWTHCHFEILSRQPSGKWGTQDAYAFIWEAYLRQYKPKLIAVARPHVFARAGEKVLYDGNRSWSAAGKITRYEWIFSDGTTATGSMVSHTYDKPGSYSEVLKITDSEGRVDYDIAEAVIVAKSDPLKGPPGIHATYFPTFGIQPGDPVTFKVRTFGTTHGKETWDFGDGTPPVQVQSDGNENPNAANGYAVTTHHYRKPGHYLVRVQRTSEHGHQAIGRLHVRVAIDE